MLNVVHPQLIIRQEDLIKHSAFKNKLDELHECVAVLLQQSFVLVHLHVFGLSLCQSFLHLVKVFLLFFKQSHQLFLTQITLCSAVLLHTFRHFRYIQIIYFSPIYI